MLFTKHKECPNGSICNGQYVIININQFFQKYKSDIKYLLFNIDTLTAKRGHKDKILQKC